LINTARLAASAFISGGDLGEGMAACATAAQLAVPAGRALKERVEVAPARYDSARLITGSRPRPKAVAWAS